MFRKIKFALTCALVLSIASSFIVERATAAATTYEIQNYPADQNQATLRGTITTDGTIGLLAGVNILKWTWTIYAAGFSPFTLSSSSPGAQITGFCAVASSKNITIVASGLFTCAGQSLQLSDGFNQPTTALLGWRRTLSFGNGINYSASIPGSLVWFTSNPAMGGTDPWVIASVPGQLLYTVTNANKLAAVNVSLMPLASGTTIIGVTQDSVSGPVRRIRGLAYDIANKIMYGMTREGVLVKVDIFTGKTTPLLSFGAVGDFWSGLAFDGTNKLYTTNAFGAQQLAEISQIGRAHV